MVTDLGSSVEGRLAAGRDFCRRRRWLQMLNTAAPPAVVASLVNLSRSHQLCTVTRTRWLAKKIVGSEELLELSSRSHVTPTPLLGLWDEDRLQRGLQVSSLFRPLMWTVSDLASDCRWPQSRTTSGLRSRHESRELLRGGKNFHSWPWVELRQFGMRDSPADFEGGDGLRKKRDGSRSALPLPAWLRAESESDNVVMDGIL